MRHVMGLAGMYENFTDEELRRPIWLVGHSLPKSWAKDGFSNLVLDPRHPTRHSIWTSVADCLQERVFDHGPYMRLDVSRLLLMNAFVSADDVLPRLDMNRPAIVERMAWLTKQIAVGAPRLVITFSAQSYALVNAVVATNLPVSKSLLGVERLGDQFRAAIEAFDPERTNVIPLLHASVARRSWDKVGGMFSGSKEPDDVYFEYAGRALGDLLLAHARDWPIWRQQACQAPP